MRATRTRTLVTAVIALLVVGLILASCSGGITTTTAATSLSSDGTDGQSTVTSGPIPTTTSTVLDPAALYSKECSGCHKHTPTAPGGENQIKGVITMGKGGMPSFSGTLTPEQIAAVAKYVADAAQ